MNNTGRINKKGAKPYRKKKDSCPEIKVKTMYLDGVGTLADAM